MAKGNPLLGMARGKVGDVVMYRANGEQVMRARNRHPRNPNTNAQIIQRAVMAGVQRVYSLGYQLFNHAFQGYRVGAENQRRFVKVNADKIRKAVLAALNGSETPVYLGAPGILSPVPNEYIVSEGNYDQTLLSIDATTPANPAWVLPTAGSATTIGAYAAAHGLVDGDIYTIVGIFTKSDTMDYEYFDQDGQLVEDASVRKAYFAYLQLRVKAGTQASTAALSSSTQWDDIFDEAHGTTGSKTIAEGLDMVDVSGIDGSGAWTVIRSRENEDLRSTSTLQLFGNQSGVTPEWLFDVWSKEAANLASDLTLEGSNFSGAGGSASPTLVRTWFAKNDNEEAISYMQYFAVNEYSNGSLKIPVIQYTEDEDTYYVAPGIARIWTAQGSGWNDGGNTLGYLPIETSPLNAQGKLGIPADGSNNWAEEKIADVSVDNVVVVATLEAEPSKGQCQEIFTPYLNLDEWHEYPQE